MNRNRYSAEYVRLYEKLKTKVDLDEMASGLTKVMDDRILHGKNTRVLREPLKGVSYCLDDVLYNQSLKQETGMNAVDLILSVGLEDGMPQELLALLLGLSIFVVDTLDEDDICLDEDGTFVTKNGTAVFMGGEHYEV